MFKKETFILNIKKIAVFFLASLMLLGVVPISMLTMPTTVNAEGEFLRFSPSDERFIPVGSISNPQLENGLISNSFQPIGNGYNGYFEYDFSSLLEKDIDEIHTAKLRMAVIRKNKNADATLQLSLASNLNSDFTLLNSATDIPRYNNELGRVSVCGDENLVEFDITTYLKEWLDAEQAKTVFRITSLDTPVAFAGSLCEDSTLRPCLKVVTGDATDPDPNTLIKTTFVADNMPKTYALYSDNSVDLKFNINLNNIHGSVYSAVLNLDIYDISSGSILTVSEKTSNDSSVLYKGKPQKEISLTDSINRAVSLNQTELILTVACNLGEVSLSTNGDNEPSLTLWTSDKPEIIAVHEAILNILGSNTSSDEIKSNLLGSYLAENGKKANVTWKAIDMDSIEESANISGNGTIYPPAWYEDEVSLLAVAEIHSGDYVQKRSFSLNIPPSPSPDYTSYNLASAVILGNKNSEKTQDVQFEKAPMKAHNVNGEIFYGRKFNQDSLAVVNLKVDSSSENFFTFKTVETSVYNSSIKLTPINSKAEPVVLTTANITDNKNGFVYFTSALPFEYTNGKEYISLKIEYLPEFSDSLIEETNNPGYIELFGVYITQTPYFDPVPFSEYGERICDDTSVVNITIDKFVQGLSAITKRAFPVLNKITSNFPTKRVETAYTISTNTLAYEDGKEKVAITLSDNNDAEIYRSSACYTSYYKTTARQINQILYIDYGKQKIFQNTSADEDVSISSSEFALSGLYNDIVTNEYFKFLKDGEIADNSVLPEETSLLDGNDIKLAPGQILILNHLADPLYYSDWRVSELNEISVSKVGAIIISR